MDSDKQGLTDAWGEFAQAVRERNLRLGTLVAEFEDCVNLQAGTEENVESRIKHAKIQEEIKTDIIALQELLMSKMAEGTQEAKRSEFFTHCYNYTNSVDRFLKLLDKSMAKERKRLEANRGELVKITESTTLTAAERSEAISQCESVENITKEKEAALAQLKQDMSAVLQQLRYQASVDVEQAKAAEDGYADEGTMGKLIGNEQFKRKAPYWFIAMLFIVALVLGSIKWYMWWTAH